MTHDSQHDGHDRAHGLQRVRPDHGLHPGGSALTALTTSFTVDIIGTKGKSEEQVKATRQKVHLLMALLMGIVIFVFYLLNTKSAIDAVYKLASYTYGPILGSAARGRRRVR